MGLIRIGLFMVFLLLPAFLGGVTVRAAEFEKETLTIEANGGKLEFTVEIARSVEQRLQGLMYRKELQDRAGMLFDYGYPQDVAMWMKNTYIPLDMLFIRSDGTIARIVQRTTPHSLEAIGSGEEVRAVLELKGGMTEQLKIDVGDRVIHPLFGNVSQ